MKGLRTGTYADGAIIAEEMLEFRVGDKGGGDEGQRVLTAVMVKDSRRYAATDGWGCFAGGSRSILWTPAQQTCHQCLLRQDNGYVFAICRPLIPIPYLMNETMVAGIDQLRRTEGDSGALLPDVGSVVDAEDATRIHASRVEEHRSVDGRASLKTALPHRNQCLLDDCRPGGGLAVEEGAPSSGTPPIEALVQRPARGGWNQWRMPA
jgi:hypothetical protein